VADVVVADDGGCGGHDGEVRRRSGSENGCVGAKEVLICSGCTVCLEVWAGSFRGRASRPQRWKWT